MTRTIAPVLLNLLSALPKVRAPLAALASVALMTSPAGAQEVEDRETEREDAATLDNESEEGEKLADRIQSVERKVFLKRRRFEILPYIALDLNDPFFQHFFVGAVGAYHFQDSLSLELRTGFALPEIQKGSVQFVRVATGSLLEGPPTLVAHADVSGTWAPIYGKLSLFGESILHFDTFLGAGLGIFVTQRSLRENVGAPLEDVTNVNPAFNVAIGQRYFINEWLTFRVELRNYTFIETYTADGDDQVDVQNVTMLGFAVSFFFPTTFAYEYQ